MWVLINQIILRFEVKEVVQSPDSSITLRGLLDLPKLIWGSPAPPEWSYRDRDRQPRPCMRAVHDAGDSKPSLAYCVGQIRTLPR